MLAEILETLDVIHAFVIRKHSDHLVVDFTAIIKGHHADDPGFNNRAGDERFRDVDDLNIKRITVFIPGARNTAVGEGVSKRGIPHTIQLEVAGFRDQLVLVDRVGVELHDRVETKLGFISEGWQHMQQVRHAAAGSLIEIGHGRRWTAPGSYGQP